MTVRITWVHNSSKRIHGQTNRTQKWTNHESIETTLLNNNNNRNTNTNDNICGAVIMAQPL